MITILLTCLLLAGETFALPADWTLEKIVGGGRPALSFISGTVCMDKVGMAMPCPEPRFETRVTIRREVRFSPAALPKEAIPVGAWDIPKGCTVITIEGGGQ